MPDLHLVGIPPEFAAQSARVQDEAIALCNRMMKEGIAPHVVIAGFFGGVAGVIEAVHGSQQIPAQFAEAAVQFQSLVGARPPASKAN